MKGIIIKKLSEKNIELKGIRPCAIWDLKSPIKKYYNFP